MSFDADAQDHIDAKIAVDGFMWPHVQNAINDFVLGCKADPSPIAGTSNWDAMKACCLLAGSQTYLGALVPLKGPAPTNFNFTSADYHPAMGLKGDGASKSLGVNRAANADPQDNMSLAAYVTEEAPPVGGGTGSYIGTTRTTGARSIQIAAWRANTNAIVANVPGRGVGLVGLSRHVPGGGFVARKWGDSLSFANQSMPPIDQELYVFRSGTASEYIEARVSFYEAGESVDLTLLDKRLTKYMQDIQMPARRGFPLSRLVN